LLRWKSLFSCGILLVVVLSCSSEPLPSLSQSGDLASGRYRQLLAAVDGVREMDRMYNYAAELRIPKCMRAEGFEYWEASIPSTGLPDAVAIDDVQDDDNPLVDAARRNAEYVNNLTEEERYAYGEALFGAESLAVGIETERGGEIQALSGGCLGMARGDVVDFETFLEIQAFLYDFEDLTFEVADLVEGSIEYNSLSSLLTECVRSNGFETDALDPQGHDDSELDAEAATAAENCRQTLDLDEQIDSLYDLAGDKVLLENEALLLSWHEIEPMLRDTLRSELQITDS
jgi:hypothetical protein